MIVKIISHNNMKRSVGYLYDKASNDPENAGQHPRYSTQISKDDFINAVSQLNELRSNETQRKSLVNNQINHLVLSFHPSEDSKIEDIHNEVLDKLFKFLEFDPENHLANVFIHNDAPHPHLHVLYSRIGEDLSVVNEGNIGFRIGNFAEEISKEYGLKFKGESPKIVFSRRDLYRPNERTALLKLIDYALKESDSLDDYQRIIKQHGVKHFKTKGGEMAYLLPNPKVISNDEFHEVLYAAKKFQKDRAVYTQFLKSRGIIVKFDDLDRELYSFQKHIYILDKNLPKMVRGKQLLKSIESTKKDPEYERLKGILRSGIEQCETLGDIQALLKGAKMRYKLIDNRIEKISFEYDNHFIRLNEVFTFDVKVENYKEMSFGSLLDIPIIFQPRDFVPFDEEFETERLRNNRKYKKKQIGFKHKI